MTKYQVTEKIGCPLLHKIVRRCKYRYLWYAYKALAKNRWQSSKRRAVFLSGGVSPADPYVSVQIVRVAVPVPYGYVFKKKKQEKTKRNQYRYGAGIAIRKQASVRMHADPGAGCFSREKKNSLPVPIKNYFVTCEWLCMRGGVLPFEWRLAYGSACIGTNCASRNAGTIRIRFKKNIEEIIKPNGISIGEVPVLRFVYEHRCRCMRIRRRDAFQKEK
jgi:hypothetical protein